MSELRNIPRLRFSDFNYEWTTDTLNSISNLNMGQSPNSSSYNQDEIGMPLIQGNADITNRKSKPRQWTTEPTKLCDDGDLIMTVRAPVGYISKSIHNACIGRGVCSIKPKGNNSIEFIYQFLLGYEKDWRRLEQGSTFTAVNSNDIKSIKLSFPSLPEQQKIADFLTSVDKRIELLEKKKTLLETYKKGVMKKIFNQEIRFKDDNGRDFPEWKKKKLVEFKELIHGDGDWILSKDITIDEKYKIIQLGSVGFGKLIQKDLKTVSQSSFEDIKGTLIEGGDLLINRMVDQKLYACIFNESSNHITSVDVCWIRENDYFDNYFLLQQILTDNYQRKLLNLSSGSGRVRISKKNLFEKVKFQFPCKIEQKKISNFLSKIDFKIELMDVKIDKSKTWKKGLLQKMFV